MDLGSLNHVGVLFREIAHAQVSRCEEETMNACHLGVQIVRGATWNGSRFLARNEGDTC